MDSKRLKSPYELIDELAQKLASQEAITDQLIEVLTGREVLTPGHRKLLDKVGERAGRKRRQLPLVRFGSYPGDKYTIEGADIDCASLMHLCRARCCRLEPVLTEQDLDEGKLEWERRRPYVLKRADDGYCNYLGSDGGCTCYQVRPGACRVFDCRHDPRIWTDFDNKLPAPGELRELTDESQPG